MEQNLVLPKSVNLLASELNVQNVSKDSIQIENDIDASFVGERDASPTSDWSIFATCGCSLLWILAYLICMEIHGYMYPIVEESVNTTIFEDLYNFVFGKVKHIPKIEIWNDMYKLWGVITLYFSRYYVVSPKLFYARRIRNSLIVLVHVCMVSVAFYYYKINGLTLQSLILSKPPPPPPTPSLMEQITPIMPYILIPVVIAFTVYCVAIFTSTAILTTFATFFAIGVNIILGCPSNSKDKSNADCEVTTSINVTSLQTTLEEDIKEWLTDLVNFYISFVIGIVVVSFFSLALIIYTFLF